VNSLIFLLIGTQEVEQHFSGLSFAVLVVALALPPEVAHRDGIIHITF
jgi:hypothetical protein